MNWSFKVISEDHSPRQCEYHPSKDELLFGTVYGEIYSVNTITYQNQMLGYFGKNKHDVILGICWLRSTNTDKFISGSSLGKVCLGSTNYESNARIDNNMHQSNIIKEYPSFDRLTSVHVNCSDSLLLLSGYTTSIDIIDMETGVSAYSYQNIHQDHINISRFCNQSPHLFATSSFDGTIKTWDLRMNLRSNNAQPIYTLKCNSGIVMINFSNDDNFILASAVDNEIQQYLFMTGEKHLSYQIASTGLDGNFSRAYYSASGSHVIAGSCEESSVKMLCAYTGDHIANIEIYPQRRDKSLYIQSLRANPRDDNELCVLVSYRDIKHRELVIVKADVTDDGYNNHIIQQLATTTSNVNNIMKENIEAEENLHTNITSNNIFYQFYSPKYIDDLRKLCTITRELIIKYNVSLPNNNTLHSLDVTINCNDITTSTSVNHSDMILLTDISFEVDINNDIDSIAIKKMKCYVYPIHSFILMARCPIVMKHMKKNLEYEENKKIQVMSIQDMPMIDMSFYLKSDRNYLLPLLIEYLYTGNNAIDVMTIRYYSLLFYLKQMNDSNELDGNINTFDIIIGNDMLVDNISIDQFSIFRTMEILLPLLNYILQVDIIDTFKKKNLLTNIEIHNEILMKIVIDDYTWLQSELFNKYFIQTIRNLIELAIVLDLPELKIKIIQLLENSIFLINVRFIYKLAMDYNALELKDLCLVFITNHHDIFLYNNKPSQELSSSNATNINTTNTKVDVLQTCIEMDDSLSEQQQHQLTNEIIQLADIHKVDVVSLKEFSNRKALINMLPSNNSIKKQNTIDNEDNHNNDNINDDINQSIDNKNNTRRNNSKQIYSYYSPLNEIQSTSEDPDRLCLYEEMPFLPGASVEASSSLSISSSSICLPRYAYVSSCRMLTSTVVFFGQMIDRTQNLSTRILSYNYTKDHFSYLQGYGTHQLKAGNFIQCFSLQAINPTHMIVLGKLKSASIGSKHTNLYNHLVSIYSKGEYLSYHNITHDKDNHSIEITKNGLISTIQNKVNILWNQVSADSEASISSNTNTSQFINTENTSDISLLLNSMGAIYELDFTTLNWRSPVVEMVISSMYESQQASSIRGIYFEQENIFRESLQSALKNRLASAIIPLYHQDVLYQCSKCIFQNFPFIQCSCENFNGNQTPIGYSKCWFIQFGGFCSKDDIIKNDLHVLVCDQSDSFSTYSNGFHLNNNSYRYHWLKTRATGKQPQARFSHSSVLLPATTACELSSIQLRSNSSKNILLLHSRILYYGGVGYGLDINEILSLRINYPSKLAYEAAYKQYTYSHADLNILNSLSTPRSYLHWEKVDVRGRSPPRRQQHSMVLLNQSNTSGDSNSASIMCLLFGGYLITSGNSSVRETCVNDLWCLVVYDFIPGPNNNDIEDCIYVYWQQITTCTGIPPSPRSRNIAFNISSSLVPFATLTTSTNTISGNISITTSNLNTIFIFGGSDDSILRTRQLQEHEQLFDFDEGRKDSIMHILQLSADIPHGIAHKISGEWINNQKKISTFIYYPYMLTLPESICTLSQDMSILLESSLTLVLSNQIFDNKDTYNSDIQSLPITLKSNKQFDVIVQDNIILKPNLLINVFPLESTTATTSNTTTSSIATSYYIYSSLCSIRCNWINIVLNSQMKESQENCLQIYHDDISIIKLFIIYLYSDKLLFHSIKEIIGILELSNQYNIELLTKLCEGILIRIVTSSNALEFIDYADIYNLNILKHVCLSECFRNEHLIHMLYFVSIMITKDQEEEILNNKVLIIPETLDIISSNEYFNQIKNLYCIFKSLNIELQNEIKQKCLNCINKTINNVYFSNIQAYIDRYTSKS